MAQEELVAELLASHARYPSLFDEQPDPMAFFGVGGRLLRINAAALRLLDYAREDLQPYGYRALLEPGALRPAIEHFRAAADGRPATVALRLRAASGSVVAVEASLVPAMVRGRHAGVYASGKDVTGRERIEAAYREQTDRIRELFLIVASGGRSPDAQIAAALNLARRHLRCDGAALRRIEGDRVIDVHASGVLAGREGRPRPLAGALDRHVAAIRDVVSVDPVPESDREREGAAAYLGVPIHANGAFYGSLAFANAGERTEPFAAGDRDFARLVGALASSALERGEQRKRLDSLAFFDALTGLPNRVLLADRLSQAVATAARHRTFFALHFYDLDGFKAINDTHGHLVGDDVLRAVARRFERAARDEDTIARIGGDEFVVVQPDVRDRADAVALAERLRATLAVPIDAAGVEHRLTASAGIALFPHDGKEPATLLARADAALYRVKATGRDGISFVEAAAS